MDGDCSVFRFECDYESALIVQANRMVNFGVEKRVVKRVPLDRNAFRGRLKQDMSNGKNQSASIDTSRFHLTDLIKSGARSTVGYHTSNNWSVGFTLRDTMRIWSESSEIGDIDNNGSNRASIEAESTMAKSSIGIDIPDLYDYMEPKRGGLIDPRLGEPDSPINCTTCGLNSIQCVCHAEHAEDDIPELVDFDLPPLENDSSSDSLYDESNDDIQDGSDIDIHDLFINNDQAYGYTEGDYTYNAYSPSHWTGRSPMEFIIGQKN